MGLCVNDTVAIIAQEKVDREVAMPRLEDLSELQRKNILFFPCLESDTAPFTPMKKELSRSKVALVTSAGLHLRDDAPFGPGDTSFRVIPSGTKASEILQSHSSIGFDHTAFYRDINVTFPVDRLQELVARGVIGSVSENYYSYMGAERDPKDFIEKTGPEVASLMIDEGVDVVFITPT